MTLAPTPDEHPFVEPRGRFFSPKLILFSYSMHPKIRWILFVLFVLFFVIGAPALVLYTAGYRFNLESKSFLRTGVLSIGTDPRNAQVTLNNEPWSEKTPTVIKQLMPGTYHVLLTREGYHPWDATIKIRNGATTLLADIPLFLDQEIASFLSGNIINTTPSPTGKTFAYTTKEEAGTETWITNTEDEPVLIERITSSTAPTLLWSSQGSYLAFFDAEEKTVGVFSVDGSPVALPDNELTAELSRIAWAPGSDHLLTLSTETETWTFNVESGVFTLLSASDVLPLDTSLLSWKETNGLTELHLSENGSDRVVALLPAAEYEIVDRDQSLLLLQGSNQTLVLIDMYANDPMLFKQQATLFSWDKTLDRIAYSDGYEVNMYDTSGRRMSFLTRQGTQIIDLIMHPSGSILLATATEVTAMEQYLIEDVHPTTSLLTSTHPIDMLWISENGKTAFIQTVSGEEQTISSLELTR